jgi:hypothetical protein
VGGTVIRFFQVPLLIFVIILCQSGCIQGDYFRSSAIRARASSEDINVAFESVKRIGASSGLARSLSYSIG